MADYGNIMGFPADTSTADAHYNAAMGDTSIPSWANPLSLYNAATGVPAGAMADVLRTGGAALLGGQVPDPTRYYDQAQADASVGLDPFFSGLSSLRRGALGLLGATASASSPHAAPTSTAPQGAPSPMVAPPTADEETRQLGPHSPIASAARTSSAVSGSSPLLAHMLQELHDKAMGNGVSAYQEALKRHASDLPGADLDAAANDAAAKMGLPNEGVDGMSKHNKAMLLLQFGLGTMAAASQPGANFFGAIAHGGQQSLGALSDLQKQRREEMKDARAEALQNWEMKRTGNLDAASAAQAEQSAADRQFQNQLGVGALGVQAQTAEEAHQDRMAAIQEKERVARARVAAKNNVLGVAQKMAHDQFIQQSNPLTNPAALDAGFKPKSETDFLEEILSRSPQWQALQTADAMDGTVSAPLGMLGGSSGAGAAAPTFTKDQPYKNKKTGAIEIWDGTKMVPQ